MTKQRKKSTKPIPVATAPDNGDQISDLPVEIQHKILQNLSSHKHAARTSTLSKRWRSVWRSYPDVVFDEDINADGQRFQNFVESEFRRLSLDNQFKMQTLDVTILGFDSEPFRSPALEQLLSLASEKKATKVAVNVPSGYVRLPYRLLSNSGVESLNLTGIKLDSGNDDSSSPLSLNSLRSLDMENFHMDESFFTNLIASCPLLRILQLQTICNMRKLKVSNATNLRTFLIHSLGSVEEIEIEAPGLEYLEIIGGDSLIKLELRGEEVEALESES
ncbi:F-box/FBD/LRR-repeat protein At2g04230 [Linum grandiflorum]